MSEYDSNPPGRPGATGADPRIDGNDLITPHQVQAFMLAKSKELDDAAAEYIRQLKHYPEAKRVARIAMNTALVGVEGKSKEIREAKAEQQCEEAIYAETLADALVASAKAAWQTKLAQLNAGQSLSSTVREEMRLAR